MPVTSALGEDIKEELKDNVQLELRPGQTFEAWLTSMLDAMPFLSQEELLDRRAQAALVTRTIAEILDNHQRTATTGPAPEWLLQLVRLWHAERAVIITFNYDCLVERAINTARLPVGYSREHIEVLRGMDVASPAPPRRETTYMQDGNTNLAFESMTLVKMHGSLNWYRADGDEFGATLIQDFDFGMFGGVNSSLPRGNPELLAQMDRFIIPPTSDKNHHYGAYLSPALWKTARKALSSASRVTFMGYSLPPEDRVSVELMTYAPQEVPTAIADRTDFNELDVCALPSRLKDLGFKVERLVSGDDAIQKFVTKMLHNARRQLSYLTSGAVRAHGNDCYVVWADATQLREDKSSRFNLLISDENDPTLLHAIPFDENMILSNPYTFDKYAKEESWKRGVNGSKLLKEQNLRHILDNGTELHIDSGNGIHKPVIGLQRVASPRDLDGDMIALHTVEAFH